MTDENRDSPAKPKAEDTGVYRLADTLGAGLEEGRAAFDETMKLASEGTQPSLRGGIKALKTRADTFGYDAAAGA